MKAIRTASGRYQIVDGNDLVTVWLDENGFSSQRIINHETDPIGHQVEQISMEDLILAVEGQKKLL